MKNKFESLCSDDNKEETVVSSLYFLLKSGDFTSIATEAFRANCFNKIQNDLISQGKGSISPLSNKEWSSLTKEGIDGEILGATTKGWKKGKVRIKVILEFCPEDLEDLDNDETFAAQPKSPLDDIRKTIRE